jgi:hypothetical protein
VIAGIVGLKDNILQWETFRIVPIYNSRTGHDSSASIGVEEFKKWMGSFPCRKPEIIKSVGPACGLMSPYRFTIMIGENRGICGYVKVLTAWSSAKAYAKADAPALKDASFCHDFRGAVIIFDNTVISPSGVTLCVLKPVSL